MSYGSLSEPDPVVKPVTGDLLPSTSKVSWGMFCPRKRAALITLNQCVDGMVLRRFHWRTVAGLSPKSLASAVAVGHIAMTSLKDFMGPEYSNSLLLPSSTFLLLFMAPLSLFAGGAINGDTLSCA